MSTPVPAEPQGRAKHNTQAIASLILGVSSFFIRLISGCVPIVAGLLAIVAGVRGLRASRQLEGRGRVLSIVGIAMGCLAFLVFTAELVIAFVRTQQQVQGAISLATASATSKTYQGDKFTVRYPGNWQALDFSQVESCKQTGVECLLGIRHPSGDGTSINLVRFALEREATLEDVDQESWRPFEASNPDVILESREAIEINGVRAIKRIFSLPSDGSEVRQQILHVSLIDGLALYQFTASAPSAEVFEQHQKEMEGIVTSLQFTP